MTPRFLFFTGKGGVGKTTLAAARALALASGGKRVLLVSTDPASNLGETLATPLGPTPREVPGAPGLCALDIDPVSAAESYRHRVLAPYAGVVPPKELEGMREELSGACTVEIAAYDQFAGLLGEDGTSWDHVVFDTAPTGHTLRLLELSRAWTGFFAVNARGASCLGPHGGLTTRIDRFEEARRALEDPARTLVVLVARPDASSLAEASRTAKDLAALGITRQELALNGVFEPFEREGADPVARAVARSQERALEALPEGLRDLPRTTVPLVGFEAIGVAALRALLAPPRQEAARTSVPVLGPSPLPGLTALVDDLATRKSGLVLVMGKGGVGKTTMAAALAVALVRRGLQVLLTTTDPAAHLTATLAGSLPGLEVGRIDPKAETEAYIANALATKGAGLDEAGRRLLEEDLRSPCTEEVAVFHAFSRVVARARGRLVILDTAPTGHTLLLLDAAGSYHREVLRDASPSFAPRLTTPLMRLRDPSYARIVLVTLPERTPVSEAAALQEDLRRAGIEPWGWILNRGLPGLGPEPDPVLAARAALERRQEERVLLGLASRVLRVPWQAEPPVGLEALLALTS
ncbi:MAG: arsenical pump-driving ATPase [Acidobacteria bacterium]|nr:arsenical pump-driving ATPase [Acidobacteriota bacterium]